MAEVHGAPFLHSQCKATARTAQKTSFLLTPALLLLPPRASELEAAHLEDLQRLSNLSTEKQRLLEKYKTDTVSGHSAARSSYAGAAVQG